MKIFLSVMCKLKCLVDLFERVLNEMFGLIFYDIIEYFSCLRYRIYEFGLRKLVEVS